MTMMFFLLLGTVLMFLWFYTLDLHPLTSVLSRQFGLSRSEISDKAVVTRRNKSDEPNSHSEYCIEVNICKNSNETVDIYYYTRTDFDKLVEQPVNFDVNISHGFQVVPRKVHFVLFSDGNLQFRFHYMIAILAASRFVKPDKIYFWHDNLPVGKYWEEIQRRVKNLYLVHRDRPSKIRGNDVRIIEHVSDVVRLEAVLEYGGIYLDMDSIVVKDIDPLLVYDVTLGQETSTSVANGVIISKQWADFLKIWHRNYATFRDAEWLKHSALMPHKLSKKYPQLAHIEPKSLCRPNNREIRYIFGNEKWDWQRNNYVVHLYMRHIPRHLEERNAENIKNWNTTAGSIMRYIYYNDTSMGNNLIG